MFKFAVNLLLKLTVALHLDGESTTKRTRGLGGWEELAAEEGSSARRC